MKRKLFAALLLVLCLAVSSFGQTTGVEKVVLQGYWWNFSNTNFTDAWADYLTELAPRLKAIGIDAVWFPPAYKNSSPTSVGYSPFDEYDLGDKFQKGYVKTTMGDKDELLRMIAVFHANNLEAIEDIVLNQVCTAGSNNGSGGQDPETPYSMANEKGFKNFRYVSYATPAIDETSNDYWTRSGRWPKNYENFYPNANNNCTTGDICTDYFGPDVSYEASAYGRSSNIPTTGTVKIGSTTRAYVNPVQTSNYMNSNASDWIIWLKKQTAVDGFRLDAVKNYPTFAQQNFLNNVKYNTTAWAEGSASMFCIGEWVDSKAGLDNYVLSMKNGNELLTGTFDFSLRGYGPNGGLYSMVSSQGGYNMQNLPGEQQDQRFWDNGTQRIYRTGPFVNDHDTFRPILLANGNYSKALGDASGWDTGNELGGNGQHIDPRDPRLYACYATVFAMDGNPMVYFEDLFDIGTTGNRYSHLPANDTTLPVRMDIVNIIQAHQRLGYKDGAYAVPTSLTGTQAPYYLKGSSADHIVFERVGKALIGITDAYNAATDTSADQQVWVSVGSASWYNTDLIDYSGAHGVSTTHVYQDGRVLIKTAPAGHNIAGARGHGYSVWAPPPAGVTITTVNDIYNYLAGYIPPRDTFTTQEWEMADDLGDINAGSLMQGGQLPANSTAQRLVGRIYPRPGQMVTIKIYPEVNGASQTVIVSNTDGVVVATATGVSSNIAPLTLTYTPPVEGWLAMRVQSTSDTSAAQKVWVNVTYITPKAVNTRTAPGNLKSKDISTGLMPEPAIGSGETVSVYPNPANSYINFTFTNVGDNEIISLSLYDLSGKEVIKLRGSKFDLQDLFNAKFHNMAHGLYFLQMQSATLHQGIKLVKM